MIPILFHLIIRIQPSFIRKNCNYIHGSISEDDFIILGFAEGKVPDAMEGSEYIRFYKEPLKEKTKFYFVI